MGALIWLIDTAVDLYVLLIIVRAVLSWVNLSPYHPAVRFVYRTTEPVLGSIRRFIPPIAGLDLSPLIAIIALIFVKDLILSALYNLVSGPRW